MKSPLLAMAALAVLGVARAAELPTVKHARAAPQKTCSIDGMSGFVIPGTDTCVKISGYVSGEVGTGNLRH
jgi:hypothetical protein